MIRFRLSSNNYTHRAGWYLDDIVIDTYHGTAVSVTPASIEVTIPQGSTSMEQITIENMDDFPIGYTAMVTNYTDAITTFYTEDFDVMPAGWTIVDGGTSDTTWYWYNPADYQYPNNLNGTPYMRVNRNYPETCEEQLITPVIDASGYATTYLEFDHHWGYGSTTDYFVVSVYDGTQWVDVYAYDPTSNITIGGWSNPVHEQINITPYANANFQVKFYYYGESWSRWAIDDFALIGSDIPLDWLTLNGDFSTSGLLAEAESDIIDVEFYASLFAPVGSWYVDVEITSNDPINPLIIVPCTMNVVPAGPGYTVSGNVTYANTAMTVLEACTVELHDATDALVATTTTDATGYYEFTGLLDGDYTLVTDCSTTPGGVSSQDLSLVNQYLLLTGSLTELQKLAGDLNWDGPGTVTSADLSTFNQYLLLNIAGWSWAAPEWVFEVQSATVSGADVIVDYQGLCSGDVNSDFVPLAK